MQKIKNVPTNIITGSLGVGKTTLIQSLLQTKPEQERWAVLVNEFGEIGIDGAIFSGQNSEQSIFVKEVPGGCMCCTSGLPMQIALNMLLAKAKPHRLLIEPTGLGHPKEVLQTLTQPHYQDVLNVQATLTLLDVRKLHEEKWRNHATFREQVQIADTLVITKADLHALDYETELQTYLDELNMTELPIEVAEQGKINPNILTQPSQFQNNELTHHHDHHLPLRHSTQVPVQAPETGVVRVNNKGQGFYSCGWIYAADTSFDYEVCQRLFMTQPFERLKAVVKTDKGVFSFNAMDGCLTEIGLEEAQDSRVELIASSEEQAQTLAKQIELALG